MLAQVAETVLKRDRVIVLAGLAIICVMAWGYVLQLTQSMSSMDMDMAMPNMQPWQTGDFGLTFLMWAVMMIAMMTPSAAPMILTYARVHRQRDAVQTPIPGTVVFVLGYLVAWFSFSAGATLVQQALHSVALLSPETISVTPLMGGIFLLMAGLYQFTPLKSACLIRCRTPLGFLMTEWREGTRGTLVMGLRHGLYCIGCCWLLMTLLFVAGVMNLLWVILIAVTVLVEKVVPAGLWLSRAIGLVTVTLGVTLVLRGFGM